MTEQEMKQIMAGLTRSREQFTRTQLASKVRRMTERERDIREAMRNR